ncbi:uncharacterized protein B0H64DRAFT_383172 [Chaetomium fimeti]|uniref:Uncharacterized protein n=1 Tax=Chaetomium fimeti TaxID=1854472 RepID=A0AAE0HRC2_9PEZI|nr:hypothetical protein B0H64DRAFT_383172 [Chaetomium fimeti]
MLHGKKSQALGSRIGHLGREKQRRQAGEVALHGSCSLRIFRAFSRGCVAPSPGKLRGGAYACGTSPADLPRPAFEGSVQTLDGGLHSASRGRSS